jgi:hypothetical protein
MRGFWQLATLGRLVIVIVRSAVVRAHLPHPAAILVARIKRFIFNLTYSQLTSTSLVLTTIRQVRSKPTKPNDEIISRIHDHLERKSAVISSVCVVVSEDKHTV